MSTTRRTERFGLVLSSQERAGLRYLAEIEGLAEADVLRRMLRVALNDLPDACKQAIDWPPLAARPAGNGSQRAP
ncbi:MAG: hypothetical protein WA040_23030 [Anaerolineae bacterium]